MPDWPSLFFLEDGDEVLLFVSHCGVLFLFRYIGLYNSLFRGTAACSSARRVGRPVARSARRLESFFSRGQQKGIEE